MTITYPDNWHFRVGFYGAKWESYKKRSPNRWPTKRTIRRWVMECSEQIAKENPNDKSAIDCWD